jgi:hypothetical protein
MKNDKQIQISFLLVLATVLLVVFVVVPIVKWGLRARHVQSGEEVGYFCIALHQYASDHSGVFPTSITSLAPYSRVPAVSMYDSSVSIVYNSLLSGKNITSIKNPGNTIAFYESKGDREGDRWVAYLSPPPGPNPYGDNDYADLRLVNERTWRRLKVSVLGDRI